jgi:CyaY protein
MAAMDRQRFSQLSDQCLARVASWLDKFDPDEVDYSHSDGVITLEFPDRMRYVLNRQSAADQMWFAAGARAWHYDWNEERQSWLDDRDGHELFANVADVISKKLGRAVQL